MAWLLAVVLMFPFAVKSVHFHHYDACAETSEAHHHDCDDCAICHFTLFSFVETAPLEITPLRTLIAFVPAITHEKIHNSFLISHSPRAPPRS
jgi:hypothetical protein